MPSFRGMETCRNGAYKDETGVCVGMRISASQEEPCCHRDVDCSPLLPGLPEFLRPSPFFALFCPRSLLRNRYRLHMLRIRTFLPDWTARTRSLARTTRALIPRPEKRSERILKSFMSW